MVVGTYLPNSRAATLCLLSVIASGCAGAGPAEHSSTSGGAPSAGHGGFEDSFGGSSGSTGSAAGGAITGGGAAGRLEVGGSGGVAASAGLGGSAGAGGQPMRAPCSPPLDITAPLEKLSQTGCMSAADPRQFSERIIPYDVNSPLWSDSANKSRGMSIPMGQKVHIKNCAVEGCAPQDDGKWEFPVGTVMLKSFSFDDKLIETRLFVRYAQSAWVGYSYRWDEAQTDATIVPDDRVATSFDTGLRQISWTYPSRFDCMKCHNAEAGATLGPETRQMNRDRGGVNQIDALEVLGVFDHPPSKPFAPPLVTPYPSQVGLPPMGATLTVRARSYLHANCAFCHRPDSAFNGLDLRFDTSFKDTALCNGIPQKGSAGVLDGTLLTPHAPQQSVLLARMQTLEDRTRMPQIGTYQLDSAGVKLIGDWIAEMQPNSCP